VSGDGLETHKATSTTPSNQHQTVSHELIFHTILDATLLAKKTYTQNVTQLVANQRNDLPGDARQRPHTHALGGGAALGVSSGLPVGLQSCLTTSERGVQTFQFTRARTSAERARTQPHLEQCGRVTRERLPARVDDATRAGKSQRETDRRTADWNCCTMDGLMWGLFPGTHALPSESNNIGQLLAFVTHH
jgi:hypothetical protein